MNCFQKLWIKLQLLFREYATIKLFRLEDFGKPKFGMASQGMDVYGNCIIQGSDQDGKASLVVLDTTAKKIAGEVQIDIDGCHMNNINVGRKALSWDLLPLLYVSECRNQRRCFVIDLPITEEEYSLLQILKFDSKKHYGKSKYAFDWFLYGDYIYTFGMTGVDGEMEICKFQNKPGCGEYIYKDKDVISSFTIQDCHVYQGSKVIDGKLYAPFGGTQGYPTCIKIIDLQKGIVERSIDIEGLGEIEAISKYEDGFIIVDCAINPSYTYIKFRDK